MPSKKDIPSRYHAQKKKIKDNIIHTADENKSRSLDKCIAIMFSHKQIVFIIKHGYHTHELAFRISEGRICEIFIRKIHVRSNKLGPNSHNISIAVLLDLKNMYKCIIYMLTNNF